MVRYLPVQGSYLAHALSLDGVGEDALAKSLSAARVDMNPHQVDAALFAIQSPLAKGAILADEVGLGKTIEASLVTAQRWAEGRRRILLIVPASLRKQWEQELSEKFSLPSEIFDAQTYKQLVATGRQRPFESSRSVCIMSYEFAARRIEDLARVPWDLVIYDEAHRLRNVYRTNGSARAKLLRDRLSRPFKLLLTATPLQNSLMELYGLVSMIDEHHFGSEAAFRAMYSGSSADLASLMRLRSRLAPICKRTLRKTVQEAGHIKYTARRASTFDFEPRDEEVKLYEQVSAYLQRTDTIAFGSKPNQLITMVARKTLGSSTYAIQQFLTKVIGRLESKQALEIDDLNDIDTAGEIADEFDDSADTDQSPLDPLALQAELIELRGMLTLAASIGANAKGEKLVSKLPEVLGEIERRGGQRKAVIFTESVRTQKYLAELLSNSGYGGKIVLLNGSNSDRDSKNIYAGWLKKHHGTASVSGAKSADMKAAIVDAFRSEEKTILIATESGAEGINLQFCSLVINFDLPWNPQRIEQRIGRCHRYGQKIDVTVVNFLNRKNRAEERVHELLDEKFHLFEGVFGVSDEVLGTIVSGVDFEKRIFEIVQAARSAEEVDAEFERLTSELRDQISRDMQDARARLLDHLDEDVVARLKMRKGQVDTVLGDYQRRLTLLARAELPDATFHGDDSPRFDYRGMTYTTEWPVADKEGWEFFRMADGSLAKVTADRASQRDLSNTTIAASFDPRAYPFPGQLKDVQALAGKSGWLRVSKARVPSQNAVRERLILSCITDDEEPVSEKTADRLLHCPAEPLNAGGVAPEAVDELTTALRKAFGNEIVEQNMSWLNEEEARLDEYAKDLESEIQLKVSDLEAQIKDKRKETRNPMMSMQEQIEAKKQIKRLESDRDDLVLARHEKRKEIRKQVDEVLDEVAEQLNKQPEFVSLFTLRWSVPS